MQFMQNNAGTAGRALKARRAAAAATLALALTCGAAAFVPQPARSQNPPPPPGVLKSGAHMMGHSTANTAMAQPEQISQCVGCHGDNLLGRKGFSPNLSKAGVLKEYNQKTFERVMNVGITNDGGHVQKPMPVYHYPKAVSDKIYAYLSSIKTS